MALVNASCICLTTLTILVMIGLSMAASVPAPVPDDKCLRCMCEVASQCKAVGCKSKHDYDDDDQLACGFFQIKRAYYIDCGRPGKRQDDESDDVAWKRCADDYDCSLVCVKNYMRKYGSSCSEGQQPSCEVFARLHHSGPNGCKDPRSNSYWEKIRKCYYRNRDNAAVQQGISDVIYPAASSDNGQQSQYQSEADSHSGSNLDNSEHGQSQQGNKNLHAGNVDFTDQKNQDMENDW